MDENKSIEIELMLTQDMLDYSKLAARIEKKKGLGFFGDFGNALMKIRSIGDLSYEEIKKNP
jgi:hypothetical protein